MSGIGETTLNFLVSEMKIYRHLLNIVLSIRADHILPQKQERGILSQLFISLAGLLLLKRSLRRMRKQSQKSCMKRYSANLEL